MPNTSSKSIEDKHDDPQAGLRPVVMPLFPTMGSLQQVVDLATSQLPIKESNELVNLLFIYHNTLLSELQKEK